jgi:hypothetical protein
MARAQTWTRNISKKVKKLGKPSRSIVESDALENMKRRAEDLGLIIYGRFPKHGSKKKDGKK